MAAAFHAVFIILIAATAFIAVIIIVHRPDLHHSVMRLLHLLTLLSLVIAISAVPACTAESQPDAGTTTAAASNHDDAPSDGELINGRVVKVHDGDTITILAAGQRELKVRLHGIDAPEHGQPFGKAAKEVLSNAIFNREVRIQPQDRDRYGRVVAYVYYNGRNVNYDMVAWGMAWHYARYSDDERFAEAQRVASQQRRGLWQQREQAVPPWDWRHAGERR